MKQVLRRAAVGAAAFFAASAFAVPAALADTTADLDLKVGGTTVALGTAAKQIAVQVTNHGPGTAAGFKLTFDTSALDTTKVKLVLSNLCDGTTKTCSDTTSMASGENFDFPVFELERVGSPAAGPAGKLTVTVSSATADPDNANNSKTVDVSLSDTRGVDLKVLADDILDEIEGNEIIPVMPGGTAVFSGLVYNQGPVDAQGLQATIVLPPGVTFVEHVDICEYSDGDTKAVCGSDAIIVDAGGSAGDEESWFTFGFQVKVAATVVGPVNIPGGVLTVEPLGEVQTPEVAGARTATTKHLGDATVPLNADKYKDIDITDNSDDFIAYVGGSGSLPKTGTKTVLIAGIGAGVLIVGAALFLISRRRRVVIIE